MGSIAEYHYPMVTWRNQEKLLWNPIHRKTLKNRPEERVRLRVIDAMLQADWSRHRISTEEPIRDYTDASLRTDIICYSRDFDPQILVECKAEHVGLSSSAAEQAARYNHNIQAPVVLITNGRVDYWYRIDSEEREVAMMNEAPDRFSTASSAGRGFDYWEERGFAGGEAQSALRGWMGKALTLFEPGSGSWSSVQYLQFDNVPAHLNMNHYYLVNKRGAGSIALSFIATPAGGSRIMAILNREGVNKAVLEFDLDLIFQGDEPNGTIYSGAGAVPFDSSNKAVNAWFENPDGLDAEKVALMLGDLFGEFVDH